jgi:hypothetical protein
MEEINEIVEIKDEKICVENKCLSYVGEDFVFVDVPTENSEKTGDLSGYDIYDIMRNHVTSVDFLKLFRKYYVRFGYIIFFNKNFTEAVKVDGWSTWIYPRKRKKSVTLKFTFYELEDEKTN